MTEGPQLGAAKALFEHRPTRIIDAWTWKTCLARSIPTVRTDMGSAPDGCCAASHSTTGPHGAGAVHPINPNPSLDQAGHLSRLKRQPRPGSIPKPKSIKLRRKMAGWNNATYKPLSKPKPVNLDSKPCASRRGRPAGLLPCPSGSALDRFSDPLPLCIRLRAVVAWPALEAAPTDASRPINLVAGSAERHLRALFMDPRRPVRPSLD